MMSVESLPHISRSGAAVDYPADDPLQGPHPSPPQSEEVNEQILKYLKPD